jgi:hypothetical protein
MMTPFLSLFSERAKDHSNAQPPLSSVAMGTETRTNAAREQGDQDPDISPLFFGTETFTRTREEQDPQKESDPLEFVEMWEMSLL